MPATSIVPSVLLALLALGAGADALAQIPVVKQQPGADRVRANDNRTRAGVSSGNFLAVRLEARLAAWHPDGDAAPGAIIPVFAEIGRPAQVPGPLIRVPGGTDVIITVRNAIPNQTLTIHGLHSRPAIGEFFNDSITLAPGAVSTLRFRLDRPGTYYYWGTTKGGGQAFGTRTAEDAQLTGAIVVDERGQRAPKDRVIVIGMWADSPGSENNRHRQRELFVLNGRSWPHTDRMVYERGDTVRWRVINASADQHPMHLHGFYFRVNRRGDGRADSVNVARDLVNTERMLPGTTMSVSWVADRLGNWLFHCHIPDHVASRGPLGTPRQPVMVAQAGAAHANHANDMGGLVSAIEVRPAEDDTAAAPSPPAAVRRLRVVLRPNMGSTSITPFFGVALDSTGIEPEREIGQRVAPTIVLTRGEPVSIMVVNRVPEATSLHWHGIELESFFDGVPGISGNRAQVAPSIAPNDSFEVRMTPPRAGTFIYHTHVNEARQLRAGLAGALLVVDKGKWDRTKDIPVVISSPSDSIQEERAVLINGSPEPAGLDLRRGVAYRLRLINITSGRPGIGLSLKEDTTLMTWRPLAKDGADLPAARRVIRPARQPLAIGETMDVEFLSSRPGVYVLEARTALGALLGVLPIRVN
jgi:FtsP/CotA-like multicopper oxidase with cupredoxin domain